MRKLALSDDILLEIDKPARYIGGEINSVMKNEKDVDIRFVMCFPDLYEIGMSHLGIQILYEMFNSREDTWCERVYSPWTDLDVVMRNRNIPLFALESQEPVKDFDFLGITLQYEMCYTNVLQILDLGQIPILSSERSRDDIFVIGGGPCTYNPEPLADFFDMFYIGEGETQYHKLLDLYKIWKHGQGSRMDFLEEASKIPGIYVPCLYEVSYREDGTISEHRSIYEGIPAVIEKQLVTDEADVVHLTKPVVPFIKATQDRVVLEIQRGCIRGCRFCQAGMIYRPLREKSLEELKNEAFEMLKNTGHEEISLSSLSSSDYSHLPELVDYLIEECEKHKINISLPSLRIDAFSLDVMGKIQDVKKSSLTFAPEAGSQRMRNVINKGLTTEDILYGAKEAFLGGWQKVKLYFMLGLPTETNEDIIEIPRLANEIAKEYYEIPKEERNGRCQITISTSFFVPKPFTPFQWAKMDTKDSFLDKARIVNHEMKEQLNHKSLCYHWHEADVTIIEGLLARGDRRLGPVILKAYENGSLFDAWSECFNLSCWNDAYKFCDIDPDYYTSRERSVDEVFPWDFISIGVDKQYLLNQWHKAKKAEVTPNCGIQCNGCGAMRYKGGICIEHQN